MNNSKEVYIKVYKEEADNTSSLYFDGSNDYVDCGSSMIVTGGGTRTVECWAYTTAFNGGGLYQAGATGSNGKDFSFRTSNTEDTYVLQCWGVGFDVIFTVANTKNQWTHWAISYGSSSTKVYCNGTLVLTNSATLDTLSNNLWIGRWGGNYFSGYIDEVRYWNVVRSQAEIQANMNKKLTGTETGLAAYYRLDENSGITAIDSSGNGRNGTLTNGPTWSTATTAKITKTTYKGFFYDFGISSFSTSLNGGLGNLTLDIPRKFDDFGEGSIIDFNNEIRIFVYDREAPQGTQVYTGYIVGYSAKASNNETVTVDVAGYVSKLEKDVYRDSGGNYKKSYTSTEIGAIMKDIIDKYRQNNPGTSLNYSSTSIANTGKSRGVTMNNDTYLDAIKHAFELTDVNWYWYLDVDNLLYLQSIPTTPTHLFMFEKDIISISMDKSIAQTVNGLLFWNGLASTDPAYIAKSYSDPASQTLYGRQVEVKSDSRYKVQSSADDFASRFLGNYKNPFNTVKMEIADNNYGLGYDIESIKPGHTCKVRNISPNNALTGNMLITSVTYNYSSVEIVVADVQTTLDRSIFELSKKSQEDKYQNDGPNSYG